MTRIVTSRKLGAVALERKWNFENFKAKQWDEEPAHSFEELMLIYLKAKPDENRRREVDAARHLNDYFCGSFVGQLRAKDIRGYIDFRRPHVKDATIRHELSVLSAAINNARVEYEWDISNPVTGRQPKPSEGRVRWITQAQAAALLQAAKREPNATHLSDFITLALHTGCRKQELLGLQWLRVDLREKLFYLERQHTKNKKRRSIPLNSAAESVLKSRLRFRAENCPDSEWVFCHQDGKRLKDVKRAFTTACQRVGIEDFRIHDLRHTCAAWLVTGGVPLSAVRDLLGHSSVTMTEKYAHLAPENVRAAVARLLPKSHSCHSVVTLYDDLQQAVH